MKREEKYACTSCELHYGGVGDTTDADTQKLVRRLSIIRGQVDGVIEMLKRGEYCIDVITQTSAIKQGLTNVEDILMEAHLSTCVVDQIKKGDEKKATEEVLRVYKLKRK
jgi:DNA-binding FrmR family transcriptional regulator